MVKVRTDNGVNVGSAKLAFCVAHDVRLRMYAKNGKHLEDPESNILFEVTVEMIRKKPDDKTHKGRRSTKTLYYQPKTETLAIAPTGKPYEEIDNIDQVVSTIKSLILSMKDE